MTELKKIPHTLLKPTTFIKSSDSLSGITNEKAPESSKQMAKEYSRNNKMSDSIGKVLFTVHKSGVSFSFDAVKEKNKIIVPEINPVLVFFSNAEMFIRASVIQQNNLFDKPPGFKGVKGVTVNDFGNYFRPAVNCIINLQAALESFVNSKIPITYDKNEDPINFSIFHKLDNLLPERSLKNFSSFTGAKSHRKRIREIIELRNEVIHLTPNYSSPRIYQDVYRRLIKFDFLKSLNSVKSFINFYEENLIQECCGDEYYYAVDSLKD
jgi:hypothetical protein